MDPVLIIRPQVYQDLDEIAAWIQRDSDPIAIRFLDSADESFASLAGMPGIGSPYPTKNPRLQGLRCFPVKGFRNHWIFYLPVLGGFEVIRVLHGMRDLPKTLEGESP